MPKDFKVSINKESERGKEFIKVFGSEIVFIKSPRPKYILTPNKKKVLAYFLDLDLLTEKQRETLIKHLSKKFNLSIETVKKDLDKMGLPILQKDCLLIINNIQRWI